MTILTRDSADVTAIAEPLGIKVQENNLNSSSLKNKVHCVISSEEICDAVTLGNIKTSLIPGGFLLIQSSSRDPQDIIVRAGFVFISRTLGGKNFYLYRCVSILILPVQSFNFNYLFF